MGKALISLLMVMYSVEPISMENLLAKENMFGSMEAPTLETSKMASNMAKEGGRKEKENRFLFTKETT